MDYISRERAACLFKGVTHELRVVLLLHSANVRVNGVRLLSLGALRHHSSDCLSAATYGRWIRFAVRASRSPNPTPVARANLWEMSRLGVLEKILKISKTPSLTAAKATESICLPMLPKPFGNTGGMAR